MSTKPHPFERLSSQAAIFTKPHIFRVDGHWWRVNTPTDTHVPGRFVTTGEWLRNIQGAAGRTSINRDEAPARLAIARRAKRTA